ncbi:cystathionine beta-lyase [Novosphingopyxis sp. YJ-S2-01]|uniref:cystathionine beta-lyase n=1 Tax=Novosphingopyxis sp. YJ-S2-01 TaxID=2794021 RepID=UPI0018DD6920|nr:cystathionine beta-lyase [Novosphingopyxis sp. YJ-S2-01]MBH9536196.1 cystathionine beta-lyase [Novosphingopyxis sp. YJ-S2-01]
MADSGSSKKPATQLVTGGRRREWTGGAVVNPPVWRGSTHLYDSTADLRAAKGPVQEHKFFYGRRGGPTHWALAEALTELEPGAAGTYLFPSGVAAISCALLAVLKPGDTLLMTDNAYDPSRSFAAQFLKPWGVTTRWFDPLASVEEIAALMDGEGDEGTAAAILLESPGSLTFEVQDVPAICAAAKKRGVVTLLDNTWATPLFFPAMEKGVDLTILAGTKYIGGHSDVMLGTVSATKRWWPALRRSAFQFGQVISPDDAYLAHRGLHTLDVRLRRHEANALAVARWLADRPEVDAVFHPALPGCPGHETWKRDFTGSSGLFSFVLHDVPTETADAFIDALHLFGIGYSWGGFESLALPVDPAPDRTATRWSAGGPLIRLNIGLEDPEDLIADLERGFAALHDRGA